MSFNRNSVLYHSPPQPRLLESEKFRTDLALLALELKEN